MRGFFAPLRMTNEEAKAKAGAKAKAREIAAMPGARTEAMGAQAKGI
jgi:hypothetical protein